MPRGVSPGYPPCPTGAGGLCFNPPAALELAENLGWLTRCGPASGDILLPSTPVVFRGGLPAGLREQAGGDVTRAIHLLADCVRQSVAEPIPPGGKVVTAAELAAVTV